MTRSLSSYRYRKDRYRPTATAVYGTRKKSAYTFQRSSSVPRPITISTSGSAMAPNWRPMLKRMDNGCSRRSDGIFAPPREQVIADRQCGVVRQPRQFHDGAVVAGRMHDERGQTEPALQRPLRDVSVLHTRARDVGDRAKVDTSTDLESVDVHSVRGVAVFDGRPYLLPPAKCEDAGGHQRADHDSGAPSGAA